MANSSGLEDVLAKARENLASGRVTSEAGVQNSIVGPILRALGWDAADPAQWQVEYPVKVEGGRGWVDAALFGPNDEPLVFVEVKKTGLLNPKAEDQLFGYATNRGVPLLVLTDGDIWDLYLSMAAGKPSERRFVHLTLTESNDLSRVAQDLHEFIGRGQVLTGRSDDAAKARLKLVKDREIGKSGLEAAWAELLREPDEMLRDLLIERVEETVGSRPGTQDTENFLRGQLSGPRPPKPAPGDPDLKPGSGNLRGFRIRGVVHPRQDGWETLTSLASVLEQHKPGFLEELAQQGSSKRKWPRAARHDDPLMKSNTNGPSYRPVEGHADWLLLVHGSTRSKLRWMRQMTEMAGLVWASDIEPILDGKNS